MRKILFGLFMVAAILSTASGCKSKGGAAAAPAAADCGCSH